jgi:transcriptional regulator with XRE-family HTH domain
MNSPVNHVMIVPHRLEEIARFPHDTRILTVTCGLFRALSGGRVLVDLAVQNGFPAFSIDAGHRGAASVTSVGDDVRTALGLTVADLAECAGMPGDEVECIEEGSTEPTVALLRRLAAAFDAEVRLTAGHDLGSVSVRDPRRVAGARLARARFLPACWKKEPGRGGRRLHSNVAHVWHGEFPPEITQAIEISPGTGMK